MNHGNYIYKDIKAISRMQAQPNKMVRIYILRWIITKAQQTLME